MEKSLRVPEFTSRVNEKLSVSVNSYIREMDREGMGKGRLWKHAELLTLSLIIAIEETVMQHCSENEEIKR